MSNILVRTFFFLFVTLFRKFIVHVFDPCTLHHEKKMIDDVDKHGLVSLGLFQNDIIDHWIDNKYWRDINC